LQLRFCQCGPVLSPDRIPPGYRLVVYKKRKKTAVWGYS
jgi:hypothetical protein